MFVIKVGILECNLMLNIVKLYGIGVRFSLLLLSNFCKEVICKCSCTYRISADETIEASRLVPGKQSTCHVVFE